MEAMLSPKVEDQQKASGEEGGVALVNSSTRGLTRAGISQTLAPEPQILNPKPLP